MYFFLFKIKIYCVIVIYFELNYEGFIVIDDNLLQVIGICEFEQVYIWDVINGVCFFIYVICVEVGSGVVLFNGGVVCYVQVGDIIIIVVFVSMSEEEVDSFKLKLVYVDGKNQIFYINDIILIQVV